MHNAQTKEGDGAKGRGETGNRETVGDGSQGGIGTPCKAAVGDRSPVLDPPKVAPSALCCHVAVWGLINMEARSVVPGIGEWLWLLAVVADPKPGGALRALSLGNLDLEAPSR